MTSTAQLTLKTLGLSLLVLLPFLAHWLLPSGEQGPGERTPIAELIARGYYDQAYRQLRRLNTASLEPDERARAEFQLAICERLLDHPARALARLEQLADGHPLLDDYRRFWMARSLEDMEKTEAAIAAYRVFLQISRHAELRDLGGLRLAALRARAGDFAKALEFYQQLLGSAPAQESEVLYQIGRVHRQLDDLDEARKAWLQLAENHPHSSRALEAIESLPAAADARELHIRTRTYAEHDRHAQAIRLSQQFLRIYPRHQLTEEMHYTLGGLYASQGQYDKAQQTFTAVFDQHRRPSALFRTGGIQVRRGRDTEAIDTYQRFVRLFPHHDLADDSLWQAAKAAQRSNLFDLAEKFYRRLAENFPNSDHRDEAGWNIGFMFYCRGEYKKALVVFERLSRMAREFHIVDQSLFWAGKTAEHLGRSDRSSAFFQQAAQGFPRSYYSARAVALGYRREAPLVPRPTEDPHPDHDAETRLVQGVEYLKRASALHWLGLTDLARREMRAAERLNSRDLDALRLIRDRYEHLGLLDSAMRLSARLFVDAGGQEEIHRIYPKYYWNQIVQAASEEGIDPYLVLSVIRQESSFKEDAVSRAGALGLMQIMPHTGRTLAHSLGMRRFERRSLFDPEISIRLGSHILGDQVRQFAAGPAQDLGFELGLAAYNAGPRNAHRWLERIPHEDPDAFVERIPYHETRLYVKLVLKNYTIYKALSDA